MKRILFPLVIAAAMIFTSCATSKFYSQNASSVHPVAMVQPFTYLTDAVADFPTDYVKSVSMTNNAILSENVAAIGLPVDKVVPFEYNYADKTDVTVRWMRHLADIGSGAARELTIPTALLDVVRGTGCRYGMVLSDIGYVKNATQYNVERAVEVGTKIADALFNNSIDLSKDTEAYLNGMFSIIFDAQTAEVVWFGACPRDYKYNPLDGNDMRKQLAKLYKDFLK